MSKATVESYKTYSEVLHFPIEIVSRNGEIRKYTFEEAIDLYQSRIEHALSHAKNPEKEVSHCFSRIQQLRLSYFQHYGWQGRQGPQGQIAGEIASFFQKVITSPGRIHATWTLLHEDHQEGEEYWYCYFDALKVGCLFTIYHFQQHSKVQEKFFHHLHTLHLSSGTSSEALIQSHVTREFGFLLSTDPSTLHHFHQLKTSSEEYQSDNPWDRMMHAIHQHNYESALSICEYLTWKNPYHLRAYLFGGLIAYRLRQWDVASDFLTLGSKYYPKEAFFPYLMGRVYQSMKQHRNAKAEFSKIPKQHELQSETPRTSSEVWIKVAFFFALSWSIAMVALFSSWSSWLALFLCTLFAPLLFKKQPIQEKPIAEDLNHLHQYILKHYFSSES